MKHLLIVAHTPSRNTKKLATALLKGAKSMQEENLEVQLKSPFDCDAELVLTQDGILLFTPENFSSMSGALKDFFERVYYSCLESPTQNESKPYALVVRAGLDGTGTQNDVGKIITGLKWRKVLPNLLCKGDFQTEFEQQCHELGAKMAAGISNEIF